MGTQTRRASPITGQGVSRTSTWPWAPAIVQAAQMTAAMQAAAMSAPPIQ